MLVQGKHTYCPYTSSDHLQCPSNSSLFGDVEGLREGEAGWEREREREGGGGEGVFVGVVLVIKGRTVEGANS